MASSVDREEWRLTTDEKDFSWRALIGPVLTNRQYGFVCGQGGVAPDNR
jgi:hypothetical protein